MGEGLVQACFIRGQQPREVVQALARLKSMDALCSRRTPLSRPMGVASVPVVAPLPSLDGRRP